MRSCVLSRATAAATRHDVVLLVVFMLWFLVTEGRPRLSRRTPGVGQAKEAVGSEGFAVGEEREQLFLSAAVEMPPPPPPPPPPPAPLPVPPPGLAVADPPAVPAGGQAAGQQSPSARFRGEVGGQRVAAPLAPPACHRTRWGETRLPPSNHSPHHHCSLLLKRLPSCSHLALILPAGKLGRQRARPAGGPARAGSGACGAGGG